ncbi:MAG TPA: RecX family transcriptional regulator [Solirubrobacteraceae bacterium]|nr:RecX family transcriptional regulator [Solirubrobacteraceae bacterium]
MDRLQQALDLAYRHLAKRDRTEMEVRRHLEARGVDPATAGSALAELERQGYVDDARYARRFAEDRRTLDSWGTERIEQRLLSVGVAPEIVVVAVSTQPPEAELDAAVELLRRRFPEPPEDDRARNRALGLLVRRGYDLELAHDAIRALARPG